MKKEAQMLIDCADDADKNIVSSPLINESKKSASSVHLQKSAMKKGAQMFIDRADDADEKIPYDGLTINIKPKKSASSIHQLKSAIKRNYNNSVYETAMHNELERRQR